MTEKQRVNTAVVIKYGNLFSWLGRTNMPLIAVGNSHDIICINAAYMFMLEPEVLVVFEIE